MKKILALTLLSLSLWACGTTYEASSFLIDKTADFSSYKTFNFVEVDQNKLPPQILMAHVQLIQNAVAAQLVARGFQKVDTQTPDLAINIGMLVENKVEADATTNAYPMGGPVGPYRYYWGAMNYSWTAETHVDVNTYKVGTLMVDVIDLPKNNMLWHGSVTGVLEEIFKESTTEKNLKAATDELFKDFPVALPAKKK